MSRVVSCFFVYPSEPAILGDTIEQAIGNLRGKSGITTVNSWRENDIAGRFIADQVLQKISDHTAFVADVTQLNFNVAYEIGFALAKEKRVVLTRHKGVTPHRPLVADVGIFDAIGYLEYENAEELSFASENCGFWGTRRPIGDRCRHDGDELRCEDRSRG